MKESEDLESTRDFKIISGRVSDVRKRVSESGFERAGALRVRVLHEGVQHNPQVMQSLEDCSVFFRIRAGRHGFVLIRLGCLGFGRS